MERQECAALVGMIASAYPSWKPTQETVAVYVELIIDLDKQTAQNALRGLLMVSEFAPSVAGIRKKVLELQGGLPLTKTEAWESIMDYVRRYGIYERPAIKDDVVAEVVRAIGYREICQSTNTDTIRAQFLRLYEEQAQKHLEQKLSAPSFQIKIEGSGVKEIAS